MSGHPYPQSDRELIRRIERSAGHRAGYKQLVRELGLGGGRERRLLLEQLARITARGDLVKINNEQWSIPAAIPEKTARPSRAAAEIPQEHRITRDRLVAGRIDMHRDGYAFVRPNGSKDREDDLFIPPNELNGAMQGDVVLVDEAPPQAPRRHALRPRPPRPHRRNPTVVGSFRYDAHRRTSTWDHLPMIHGNYVTPLRRAHDPAHPHPLRRTEIPANAQDDAAPGPRRRGPASSSERWATPNAILSRPISKASSSTSRSPTGPPSIAPPAAASSKSSAHPTTSVSTSRSSSASTTSPTSSPPTSSTRPHTPPPSP